MKKILRKFSHIFKFQKLENLIVTWLLNKHFQHFKVRIYVDQDLELPDLYFDFFYDFQTDVQDELDFDVVYQIHRM